MVSISRHVHRFATSIGLTCLLLLNSSCLVTYRRFPVDKINAPAYQKSLGKATFHVDGVGLANGHEAIREAFRMKSPFDSAEYTDEIMAKGLFVFVEIRNIMPSIPALAFGYLSLCTLTILPAWTMTGGSDVTYRVYQDEALTKSYTYEVRRKGFVWIVLLPFAWANAMTYSESDAFTAMSMQFFEDVQKQLKNSSYGN